jgi:flavin-dependent dehydrogenase
MVSGELAARAILDTPKAPSGRALAARYGRACRREIGAELRDSVLIQRYLFDDWRNTARIIREAPNHPEITAAILQYAAGSRSYRSVRRKLLVRFPGLAARLLWERVKAS